MSSVTSDQFREVIGHFATGVAVITTSVDGAWLGTTASAVSSVSLEPPTLLVCMNRESTTGQGIAASGAFGVNVLGREQHELALHFATKRADKFDTVAARAGALGTPLLDDALAALECRVETSVPAGTHSIFIGAVVSALAQSGDPLAYFRGRFGGLTGF